MAAVDNVCKYFKFGFCKFKDSCMKRHVEEVCAEVNCSLTSCYKRHPIVCRYFKLGGRCKFGQRCAYRHEESKEHLEIENLKNEVKILVERLKVVEEQMQALNLKEKQLRNSNHAPVVVQNRKLVMALNSNPEPEISNSNENIPQLDGVNISLSNSEPSIRRAKSVSELIETDCWVCDMEFDTTEDLANNFNEGRKEYSEAELLCKECFYFLSEKFSKEDIFNALG